MGAVGRTLFGGSKSEQQSTSGPTDATPEALKALREPFVSTLTNVLQGGGRPAYEGPLTTPITGAETTGLGAVSGAAYDPTRQGLIQQTQQGAFLPGQAQANPFLQATIQAAQRPTLQGLEEVLSRALPGRFTQAGHFTQPQGSSAFDRAAALATRGAADAAGDIATNISAQAYDQERGRQQQSIQLGQGEVETLVTNLKAQGLPRLIEDMGVERGLAEFNSRMQSLMQALQVAAGSPISQIANQSQSTGKSITEKGVVPGLASLIPVLS